MKKHLVIASILFLLVSCALESKFGLPNDEKVNPELIGEWYFVKTAEDKLTISEEGDKTYKIRAEDSEDTEEFMGYSTTIKGFKIMNLKIKEENKILNSFYGFEITEDTLIFSEVNSVLHEGDFKSETHLLEFFKQNIENESFFVNPSKLIRK